MSRLALACYVLTAGVLIALVAFELSRDDEDVAPAPRAPAAKAASPAPSPSPAPTPPPAGKGLAVGVTEFNPNLVAAPAAKQVPEPWNAVRDKLGAIHPAYFRFVVDWASVQPSAQTPANMDQPQGGCMREVGPCLGWGGIREQLRALASRQRLGGWTTLVVFTSTPDWAASPPSGCERPRAGPRARHGARRLAGPRQLHPFLARLRGLDHPAGRMDLWALLRGSQGGARRQCRRNPLAPEHSRPLRTGNHRRSGR